MDELMRDQELLDLLSTKSSAEIEYRKSLYNESLAWQNANCHTIEEGYTILEWQQLVTAAGEMTIAKNSAYLALCDAIEALYEYNERMDSYSSIGTIRGVDLPY